MFFKQKPSITRLDKPQSKRNDEDELVQAERSKLLNDVFAVMYIIFIGAITIAMIIELKHEYNIDIFPGVNTPFDDIYYRIKDGVTGEQVMPPEPPQQ